LLKRLHEQSLVELPNIADVPLHTLTPELHNPFFDSLRGGYSGFDQWFREKARDGRSSWIYRNDSGDIGALCVYAIQTDEVITDDGKVLRGQALKLCTFKVAETSRGKKVGELFLKAAFKFATLNRLEHIFVHAQSDRHVNLVDLLEDFGFIATGSYRGDLVFVKEHPGSAPSSDLPPFEYLRRYYPHYKEEVGTQKFIVPIRPTFHRVLFPDFQSRIDSQIPLFAQQNQAGNAIKLAYLSHSQTKNMKPGDIVLFYRSEDIKAITSFGVVEEFAVHSDSDVIARMVSRRTVYTMKDIEGLCEKPVKIMLFRLIQHFDKPKTFEWLVQNRVVRGNIQTIQKISDTSFREVLNDDA
jgi:hypothetical protein